MLSKNIFLILIFLLVPNICYAYVDPGIFALIWQSIIAFIFVALAYFRLFYFKTSQILKSTFSFIKSKPFIFLIDYILLLLVFLIPILQLLENNQINFGIKDYFIALLNLSLFFVVIIFFVFWIFKIFSKDKSYIFLISILILLLSYFVSSVEEYIIKSILNYENVKYMRIISFFITPIILLYLIKLFLSFEINNIRIYLSTFVIIIILISFIGLLINKESKQFNDNLWKHDSAKVIKTDLKDNIFLIFTDAYISPKYYQILYPTVENNLFKLLKEKKFFIRHNSFSTYSSSKFSIASIFNSNIFSPDMSVKKFREIYRKNNNFLDKSYLLETLNKNNFNHKFFICDFKYVLKKRYCKEKNSYLSLIEDISIIEGIYYYSSFYFWYKKASLFLYEIDYFKKILDNFTKDDEGEILYFIEKKIKKTANNKKNFYSIFFSVPHVPWTLNKDCSWKSIPLSQNVRNGYLIRDENLRVNGYIDNLQCTNNYLIKLLKLIERYNENSITILISDNGPFIRPDNLLIDKIGKNQLELYDQNSSLFSVGGGSKCLNKIKEKDFHHVNLFRIILNCGKENSYSVLPHVTYINPIININKFNFKEIKLDD